MRKSLLPRVLPRRADPETAPGRSSRWTKRCRAPAFPAPACHGRPSQRWDALCHRRCWFPIISAHSSSDLRDGSDSAYATSARLAVTRRALRLVQHMQDQAGQQCEAGFLPMVLARPLPVRVAQHLRDVLRIRDLVRRAQPDFLQEIESGTPLRGARFPPDDDIAGTSARASLRSVPTVRLSRHRRPHWSAMTVMSAPRCRRPCRCVSAQ